MKLFGGGEVFKTPLIIKISAFFVLAITSFYLGEHWSDGYQQLIFFNTAHRAPSVSISPNRDKLFNVSALVHDNQTQPVPDKTLNLAPLSVPPPSSPPPPPPLQRFGIVNENGTMSDEFEVGQFDEGLVEDWRNETTEGVDGDGDSSRVRVTKFQLCPRSMSEYIPCLDNEEGIKKLKSSERGERFERHCPEEGRGLNCLVPAPSKYRIPIPWPKSRDEVWFYNVPHTRLVEDKGGQNWIAKEKDKFTFPGGGTQFIHGANEYLDHISKMIPEIAFGHHTRVVLDIGCGVASFGAYLLSRNVITMSIAPKDVHENQIQFALERGVPAMVAAFATHRLLYPSQAFDLIHCSRCRINWTRDDTFYRFLPAGKKPVDGLMPSFGVYQTITGELMAQFCIRKPILMKYVTESLFFSRADVISLLTHVNRMLRGGGYFVWAAQPVYKHEEILEEQWKEMLNLTTRLCWDFVKKDGYIAIWQKPFNNSCYLNREDGTKPPLCDQDDDPDNVWYSDLKSCISRLPENGVGANVTTWPARLQTPPSRLQSIQIDAYISRKELFMAESKYWNEIIASYVRALHWKKIRLRNVMDMRAGFGGFAAALMEQNLDSWVMNVVPVSGPNTLPVIYDRGLIGVLHDWCEPFDTYPRTYDFLHAAGLFSIERKRCNISSIVLEMDRILRPGGRVYIRDTLVIMDELQENAKAMGWHVALRDTSEGPYASYRVLTADKHLLRG